MFNNRLGNIVECIKVNGGLLVDYRDIHQVIDQMIKSRMSFTVAETTSPGIFTVRCNNVAPAKVVNNPV